MKTSSWPRSLRPSMSLPRRRSRIIAQKRIRPRRLFNDPRVHFMRNALAHVGTKQRQMVAAAIRTAFTQETQKAASTEWRAVAGRLRGRFPKLADLMDEAEDDVLAHMSFPKEHWTQLHSTNPLERLNGEIKRRTDVVAIFLPSCAWSAPCCSSRTTNGPCSAAT